MDCLRWVKICNSRYDRHAHENNAEKEQGVWISVSWLHTNIVCKYIMLYENSNPAKVICIFGMSLSLSTTDSDHFKWICECSYE